MTGAGSGIGRAIALLLAQEGAHVGALDWSARDAHETAELIAQNGGKALALVADVSDAPQMQNAVAALVEASGRLDIKACLIESAPARRDMACHVRRPTLTLSKDMAGHVPTNGCNFCVIRCNCP